MRHIGEGSFGKVYLARWQGTKMALKVLMDGETAAAGTDSLTLPPEVQARLEEEAGLMASMRHPCIVGFYGIVTSPAACLVTEYCPKGSLVAVLKHNPALAAALTWAQRLCFAVDAAHGMHDLKSPNLLIDGAWRVKVADFNLSRVLVGDAGGLASTQSMMQMNPRELLTWELPWANTNSFLLPGLVMAGRRMEIPPVSQLPGPDASPLGLDAYVRLMQQCWAQEPVTRPDFAHVAGTLE
eukprot:scaffold15.g4258.t1